MNPRTAPGADKTVDSSGSSLAPSDSLHRRAGLAALWAVLQSGGKHGIDMLVFLCLARWIAPSDFGLVAMASAVVVLAAVLAEMGLGEAIVQRGDLHPDHVHSAFWLALALGVGLALVLVAAAPLLAAAYGRAELVPVLRCLSPLFVLHALNIVPQALLQRELSFQPLTRRALGGAAMGGVAGLIVGARGGDAWSLVVQQLVSTSTGLATLWWLSPWRPRLQFNLKAAKELLAFSRFVLGARLLNVLASKADDLVVGMVLGPAALGFYNVACRMQLALEQLFCQGVDAVALSAFSRAEGQAALLRELFRNATRTAALWAFPVFGGTVFFAHDLLELTIGAKWLTSAALLQWLLLAGLLQALMHFNHAVFKAMGNPSLTWRMALASTALNIVTLAVGVRYGLEAVAMSCLARSALLAPVGVVLACRLLSLPLTDYLAGLWRPALALALAAAVVLGLTHLSATHWLTLTTPLTRLTALGLAGALTYFACVRLSGPSSRAVRSAAPLPHAEFTVM